MRALLQRLTTGSRSASTAAGGVYATLALAAFIALGASDGSRAALLSGAALLLGATLPGAAIVRVLLPRSGVLHYLVVGTTFGLMLWALGGFLSHLTGLYTARWVPSVLALLLLVTLFARGRLRPRQGTSALPPVVALGAAAGMVALAPALRTALLTQPASWDGWFSLYGDLPFQAAIAAEVAVRVPEQAPWVAGTPLSYTWAFHSAMGVWSSTSTVAASELVLQAWPVLFAALIPGLIALVAWELSRSAWVAAMAPLVFTLAHGVLIAPASFVQNPLFTVSPTRDFGHLAMLLVILALARTLGRRSGRAVSVPWVVALALAMLVATSAKGSLLPVLVGTVAATCFILVVTRRFARSDLLAVAAFAAGAVCGFAIAIPDTNSARTLGWGPLTFLDPALENVALHSVLIIVLLLFAMTGFWLVLGRAVNWTIATLVASPMLAGVLGLALLTQTGSSQNYFWQASEPLIAIAIAWCGVILYRIHGARVVLVAGGIGVTGNLALRFTSNPVVLVLLVVALAVAGAVLVLYRSSARLGTSLAVALVLTQSAQLLGFSFGYGGGIPTTEENVSGTHSSQLEAFAYIRTHSGVDDLIATNSHCLAGSLAGGDCVPQRFTLSAMSERRVLVEGWSYTQFGDSADWVREQLDASDGFIEAPSEAGARELVALGVKFVYVDLRLRPSPRLDQFADLVFESQWARVYELSAQ